VAFSESPGKKGEKGIVDITKSLLIIAVLLETQILSDMMLQYPAPNMWCFLAEALRECLSSFYLWYSTGLHPVVALVSKTRNALAPLARRSLNPTIQGALPS
jgi:hypothetical protein